MYKQTLAILTVACLAAGCAPKNTSIYHWGNYEGVIHDMYVNPGEAPAQIQIDKISQDIQQSQAQGKRVAPGLYAHLGMMYAAEGQAAQAQEALLKEKQLYPESTVLVDTLLKNQQGSN